MESIAAVVPVNTMLISALLVTMKLVLGIRVTMYRASHNIPWGDNGDDQMTRRIRAHANHSEWVPATLILLALIEMSGVSPFIIGALGAALLVGRGLHGLGLMGNAEAFNRVTGITMHWIVLALAVIIAVVQFFAPGSF
ncbi:MAG: MAPEG family protein [Alphaproteobacteria bacterium]